MLRFPAALPDAAIGLGPALARRIHHLGDEFPVIIVGRAAAQIPLPRKIQRLTVNIELHLTPCVVPDADRPAAAIPLEGFHFGLAEPPLTGEPVYGLYLGAGSGSAPFDERTERLRRSLVAQLEHRANGEGGVAHPAVSVVPVVGSGNGCGERRRRRCRDRSRWCVRQRLQDRRRPYGTFHVGTFEPRFSGPAFPPVQRFRQPIIELMWLRRLGR